MAAEPLFVDSGGFYALVSAESAAHKEAVTIMEEARRTRRRAVTTDYILDETATLLRARGLTKQLKEFLRLTETSHALSIEWMTPDRFATARNFMLKHLDQEFSFTDCASFVVMKELRLTDALATDKHFRIAGFNPLLPG
ncbi:MAG TPA: PIN domain-containing protein [Candidatus Acidoferrales bacterium]|jgi:predicted nucleic acid-binding protein|nr:PIN domain-containing protein [Candidatus Acidoferrales bacterium]